MLCCVVSHSIPLDCIGLHWIALDYYRIYLQTYLYNQIINHQFGSLNAIELVIVLFHSAFAVSCGVTSLRSTLFLTFFLSIGNDSFLGSTPSLLIPLTITNN